MRNNKYLCCIADFFKTHFMSCVVIKSFVQFLFEGFSQNLTHALFSCYVLLLCCLLSPSCIPPVSTHHRLFSPRPAQSLGFLCCPNTHTNRNADDKSVSLMNELSNFSLLSFLWRNVCRTPSFFFNLLLKVQSSYLGCEFSQLFSSCNVGKIMCII